MIEVRQNAEDKDDSSGVDLLSIARDVLGAGVGASAVQIATLCRTEISPSIASLDVPYANLSLPASFPEPKRFGLFLVKRVHPFGVRCENQSGFETSAFERLTGLATTLRVVFTVARVWAHPGPSF